MRYKFEYWDVYYYLYERCDQGQYPNLPDLTAMFSISTRQVHRAIKAIREQLGVRLIYSDERGGYMFVIQDRPTAPRIVFDKFYEAMMIERKEER